MTAPNNPSTDTLSSLAESLAHEGTKMANDRSVSPLRKVQHRCWNWQDHDAGQDYIQFMVFFLDTFIDKVFYDLTGDVPFRGDVTLQIQRTLYATIGTVFVELAQHLRDSNFSGMHHCYQKLGLAYLKAVRSLNEVL